jgi:Uma2 family endonuclease
MTRAVKTNAMPAARRWRREEYERMIAAGVIHSGERLELIDGEIRTMAAHGSFHTAATCAAQKALDAGFGGGYHVRVQMPLALEDMSEPEPDLAVVPGSIEHYWRAHPTGAALVVEVSDSTLYTDRREKGSLYARGGIREYWIVNLVKKVLEVYRDPVADPKMPFGWRYRLVQRLTREDQVSPLAKPDLSIPVDEFFRGLP